MNGRGATFELNGKGRKEDDLGAVTGGVEHGSCYTVVVSSGDGGEEGGRPSPRGDDGGSDKAGAERATGDTEFFSVFEMPA